MRPSCHYLLPTKKRGIPRWTVVGCQFHGPAAFSLSPTRLPRTQLRRSQGLVTHPVPNIAPRDRYRREIYERDERIVTKAEALSNGQSVDEG